MTNQFQSDFVFGLQGNRYEEFIESVAKPIISKIIESDDFEIITDMTTHISFKDFDSKNRKSSIFPDFYINFLADILKQENGIVLKKKVCISFDERLCNEICPITGRQFTAINIAGENFVYFIFFDIKELFDFVYKNEINHLNFIDKNIDKSILSEEKQDNKKRGDDGTDLFGLTKKAYIHNINTEKGFCFARISDNKDEGIPLPYDKYEILNTLREGDFIDLYFKSDREKYPDNIYFSENQDEIPNIIKRFKGVFVSKERYGFINTDSGESIYVRGKFFDMCNKYCKYDNLIECFAYLDSFNNQWIPEIIRPTNN